MKYLFSIFLLMLCTLSAETALPPQVTRPEDFVTNRSFPQIKGKSIEDLWGSMNQGRVDLSFVEVGDPGNMPSMNGQGAVKEMYRIGEYEVTAAEYCIFLNAVATEEDPHHLYKEEMESDSRVASIARRKKTEGGFFYYVIPGHEKMPVTYVNFLDALRFCNWLENGQPNRCHDNKQVVDASTETGAYFLRDDEEGVSFVRNQVSRYSLPTKDQWIKAAYYKGGDLNAGYWNFPTQHDAAPSNGYGDPSNQANYQSYYHEKQKQVLTPVDFFPETQTAYGVHDMGGNVTEWIEETTGQAYGGSWKSKYSIWSDNDLRMYYGDYSCSDPFQGTSSTGFRIVTSMPPHANNLPVQEKKETSLASKAKDSHQLMKTLAIDTPLTLLGGVAGVPVGFLSGLVNVASYAFLPSIFSCFLPCLPSSVLSCLSPSVLGYLSGDAAWNLMGVLIIDGPLTVMTGGTIIGALAGGCVIMSAFQGAIQGMTTASILLRDFVH